MSGHVEIRPVKTDDPETHGRVYVALVGGNGETLSTSEGLSSRDACQKNIEAQIRALQSGEIRYEDPA